MGTDDAWEKVEKHVVLTVPHSPEQSFVSVLSGLLSSGISHATEAELDPSTNEYFDAFV